MFNNCIKLYWYYISSSEGRGGVGGKLTPLPPRKPTFKKPSLIKVKTLKYTLKLNTWSIPLINCEIELTLTCTLADMTVGAAGNNNNPQAIVAPTGLEF